MNSDTARNINSSEPFIAWQPILAGLIVGLAVSIFLNILGSGLGFISISHGTNYLSEAGIGAVIWIFIAGIASMFFAGATTGIFTSYMNSLRSVYHSVITWSLSLLVTVVLLVTAAGSIIGGTSSLIAQIAPSMDKNALHYFKDEAPNALANSGYSDKQSVESYSQKNELKATAEKGSSGAGWLLILAAVNIFASLTAAIAGAFLGSHYSKVQKTT